MCFLALLGAHGKQVRPNILFAGTLKPTVSLGTALEKEFSGGSTAVDSRQPGPRQTKLPKLEPQAAPGRV